MKPVVTKPNFAQKALQLVLPLFGLDAPTNPKSASEKPQQRTVNIQGTAVPFTLKRSAKRKTFGLLINDAGLTITAPRWTSQQDLDKVIADREHWIAKKLIEWREHSEKRKRLSIEWKDGISFPLLGHKVLLQVESLDAPSRAPDYVDQAALVPRVLGLRLPPSPTDEQIANAAQAWCQQLAKRIFSNRLEHFGQLHGVRPSAWGLSGAKTRWGSCSHDGRIRLNWRLVHFPLDVIDYVVAHELAHLKELNHGPQFWQNLETLMPGYESAKKTLAQYPDDW